MNAALNLRVPQAIELVRERRELPVLERCDCPSSQLEHIDCQRLAYPLVAQHTTLLIDYQPQVGGEALQPFLHNSTNKLYP